MYSLVELSLKAQGWPWSARIQILDKCRSVGGPNGTIRHMEEARNQHRSVGPAHAQTSDKTARTGRVCCKFSDLYRPFVLCIAATPFDALCLSTYTPSY